MTMQMVCLKKPDTHRQNAVRWGLLALALSGASIGFAADLAATNPAQDALQSQLQKWLDMQPSFQGRGLQMAPLDGRITVQNCQQNLQFDQPFPNQPSVRVRCFAPQWQLFVSLQNAPAPTSNRNSPAAGAQKVLVAKDLLKRGTLLNPSMFTTEYASVPGAEGQLITDAKVLANMELVRDLPPNTPLKTYDFKPAILVKRGQEVQVTAGDGSHFSITMRAEATQDGGFGEQIRLKNTESGRIISGVVTGPGTAKAR
jgi:flagella basal body P-ring formation protein FlgA